MGKNLKSKIWFTIASLVYSFSYMILTMVVVRTCGSDEGGSFTFGLNTLGQHIFLIAYFGIRGIHITDVNRRFSYADYKINRYITVLLSIIVGIGIITFITINNKASLNQNINNIALIIGLLLLNIFEGLFDMYDCEYQRNDELELTGKSIFFRSTIYDVIFISSLLLIKNLIFSVYLSLIIKFIIEIYFIKKLETELKNNNLMIKANYDNVKQIIIEALPLAISTFLDFYVFASTKYMVNAFCTNEHNGFYGIIFMPASFMFALANLIIRPKSTQMAEYYKSNDLTNYKKVKNDTYKNIILLSVFLIIITLFIGKFALNVVNILTDKVYDNYFNKSFIILLITIGAGIFYSLLTIPYYDLIIKNKQINILKVYVIMVIVSTISSIFMVKNYNILGASIAHILNMLIMFLLLFIVDNFLIVGSKNE